MANRVAVILVVGLDERLIAHAPRIRAFANAGRVTTLRPTLPAVTCSAQASMLTGLPPREHGVVGNGWFNREQNEVQFWKQSNALVSGEKVWETARRRDPSVTCANLFWWFNMYSSVDVSVTPRPIYKADGRKIPDIYTQPANWRDELQERLGRFPLFQFWGPGASIASSKWITEAALLTRQRFDPTLSLIYLPHLDYPLQKYGPDAPCIPAEVAAVDALVGRLLDDCAETGARPIIVSEYAIEAVSRPVALNRVLRGEGWLRVREEDGGELLDAGASDAFAVVDHQVAHVYVRQAELVQRVSDRLSREPGVARVLDRAAQREYGIDHDRAGELVAIAEPGAWFCYPYWEDDRRAPDFARTVDIHRKPGYDPCELFLDPRIRFPKAAIGWRLLKRKLGMRTLMDVIPLDPGLVKGTHGHVDTAAGNRPVMITDTGVTVGTSDSTNTAPSEDVRGTILQAMRL
ncbi:MAG: alkaline phosphatase family protein [Phycisphaerales bacterium]|nr:alkaline phosphatase family protein [Phycisphaerales bacterium]